MCQISNEINQHPSDTELFVITSIHCVCNCSTPILYMWFPNNRQEHSSSTPLGELNKFIQFVQNIFNPARDISCNYSSMGLTKQHVFFQHDFPMCCDMTDRDHWLLNQTDFSSNPTCIILNMFLNLPEFHFFLFSQNW